MCFVLRFAVKKANHVIIDRKKHNLSHFLTTHLIELLKCSNLKARMRAVERVGYVFVRHPYALLFIKNRNTPTATLVGISNLHIFSFDFEYPP